MRYHNKQDFNTDDDPPVSATDKLIVLEGRQPPADHARVEDGVLRTGLWSEYASTDRYQTPTIRARASTAPLPNFHEMFGTTTLQPNAEYILQATPESHAGIKLAPTSRTSLQLADAKTVGNLNGRRS